MPMDDGYDDDEGAREGARKKGSRKKGGAAAAAESSSNPQSKHACVCWDKKSRKWIGSVRDRLATVAAGKPRYKYTTRFTDDGACAAALAEFKAQEDEEFEAEVAKRYAACVAEYPESFADLPRAPKSASDAEKGRVYWHVHKHGKYVPYRAVVTGSGDTMHYERACQLCHQLALPTVKGATPTHCKQHGGGGAERCVHDRKRAACYVCNPNSTSLCSSCHVMRLADKRLISVGGNGLCAACEEHGKEQAAENGTAPPTKSQSWEDFVFERLLPLIIDSDGHTISPELRDDFSNTIGSLYEDVVDGGGRKLRKRKRGATDCDTMTYRRPDALFIVRHPDTGRIVAALAVEVDEDCHETRKFECETGKVEDTFQALQKLAAGEGALAASRTGVRGDAELILFQTYKFNPNVCNLGSFALKDRIAVLATHVNAFLARPAAEFVSIPVEQKLVPHVTCFYYRSDATATTGEVFLEAYPKLAPQWAWGGNLLA